MTCIAKVNGMEVSNARLNLSTEPIKNSGKDQYSRISWIWRATAVLLLATVFRLVSLRDLPPGLAQDEVLNADVVTFIRGGAFSLFFREGYGHEPLYHYWSVPFQVLLGDNVLSIRLPAVALGLFLVAATMRWSKRSFGQPVAIITGLFLAVSWWPIVFSRIGLRPIMEPLFLLLFAWFWPRNPWLAGLFLGLSLYTYTGARVIFLWPILLAIYWLFLRKRADVQRATLLGRDIPQPLRAALIVLLVSVSLYLPLALTLCADPSLQQRIQQLVGPLAALSQGDLRPVLLTTLSTLGVFSFAGDPRWTYMLPDQPLFDLITSIFFYAGLALLIIRFKRPAYAFVLFWLLVGIIPSAVTPQAPSTIRMVGAMPAVYLIPALALGGLWQRRRRMGSARSWMYYGLPVLLAGLLILNIGATMMNGFVRWPQEIETRFKYQTVLLDMAEYLKVNTGGELVFADGFYRPITADSLRRNLGADPRGRWVQTGKDVAGAIVLPAKQGGRLIIPEYAAPDSQLLALAGVPTEPLYRSKNRPSFAVYDLPSEPPVDQLSEPLRFADMLSLVGYEIITLEPGQEIQIATMWQVIDELPDDLAIYVHWLDEDQQLLSQHDGLDAAPQTLRQGDLIIQRHVLPWASPLPTPAGTLRLGLYLRESGRRLQFRDGAGGVGDQIVIPLTKEDLPGQPDG